MRSMSYRNEQEKKRRPRRKRPSLMSAVWSLLPACMLKDGMEIARQLRQIQRQKRRDTGRLKNLKGRAERSAALRKDRGGKSAAPDVSRGVADYSAEG